MAVTQKDLQALEELATMPVEFFISALGVSFSLPFLQLVLFLGLWQHQGV
jgi:hypothetical protein